MSVTYSYPHRVGIAGVIAENIKDAGLPSPECLTGDGNVIGVQFADALTAPQKSTLDGVMANVNVGQPPPTVNTIFAYYDPMSRETQINAALAQWGISYQSYPGEIAGVPVVRMLFNKTLSAQDKNRLQAAVWNACVVQEQA